MSEDQLLATIIEMAERFGWLHYHVYDTDPPARRSSKGFPDLVLARCGKVLFVEVKSETGKASIDQMMWLHHLGGEVWRPSDLDMIEERLR